MRKKGAISIQLNWIFILIAGGLLLALIMFIVQTHKNQAKENLEIEIRTKLEAILAAGQESTDSTHPINIPDIDIKFDSEGFQIGRKGTPPIKFRPAFAPSEIKTIRNKIVMFSSDFMLPYRAASVLYVTTPDVRYILINDPNLYAYDLYNSTTQLSLPDNITKEIVNDCNGLTDENNPQVRIVYFTASTNPPILDDCASKFSEMADEDVTALEITITNGGIDGYGKLKFYEKNNAVFGAPVDAYYVSLQMLMGAIVSTDPATYNRGLLDSFDRLRLVSQVHHNRSAVLGNAIAGDCQVYHTEGMRHMKDIIDNTYGAGQQQVGKLYEASLEVRKLNRKLELKRDKTCPLIY